MLAFVCLLLVRALSRLSSFLQRNQTASESLSSQSSGIVALSQQYGDTFEEEWCLIDPQVISDFLLMDFTTSIAKCSFGVTLQLTIPSL